MTPYLSIIVLTLLSVVLAFRAPEGQAISRSQFRYAGVQETREDLDDLIRQGRHLYESFSDLTHQQGLLHSQNKLRKRTKSSSSSKSSTKAASPPPSPKTPPPTTPKSSSSGSKSPPKAASPPPAAPKSPSSGSKSSTKAASPPPKINTGSSGSTKSVPSSPKTPPPASPKSPSSSSGTGTKRKADSSPGGSPAPESKKAKSSESSASSKTNVKAGSSTASSGKRKAEDSASSSPTAKKAKTDGSSQAKKEKPKPKGPLTQAEKDQKKADGADKRKERDGLRKNNAENVHNSMGGDKAEYSKPDAGTRKTPGTTRLDRAEASKNSNKNLRPATGPTNDHSWSPKADNYINKNKKMTPADKTKYRKDAERVNAQSLSDPSNPVTKGAGFSSANSVIRAGVHPSLSGNPGDPDVVTVAQKRPGDSSSSVRHLPVKYDSSGNAHYDGGRNDERAPYNNNNYADSVPPVSGNRGPVAGTGFTTRSLEERDADSGFDFADVVRLARRVQRFRDVLYKEDLVRRYLDAEIEAY